MTHVGLFGRKRTADAADQPQAGTEADGIPADVPNDAAVTDAALEADDSRVDLGSLWVAIVPGVQIALQVDESTQTPVGVQLTLAGSGAYLQAYAAPRTEGIWPEIRAEVAQSVVAEGGRAEVVNGSLGKELRLHQRGGVPLRLLQPGSESGPDTAEPADAAASTPRGFGQLRPFERGPEITEVH